MLHFSFVPGKSGVVFLSRPVTVIRNVAVRRNIAVAPRYNLVSGVLESGISASLSRKVKKIQLGFDFYSVVQEVFKQRSLK